MKFTSCCTTRRRAPDGASDLRPKTAGSGVVRAFLWRGLNIGKWVAPGAALALLPKCPACLAAYIALWTGLGLSFSAASNLRMLILGVCVAALATLVARRAWHLHRMTQITSREN